MNLRHAHWAPAAASAVLSLALIGTAAQQARYDVYWQGTKISANGILVDGAAYVPASEVAKQLNTSVEIDHPNKAIRFGQQAGAGGSQPAETAAVSEPFGTELMTNGGFEAGPGASSYYDELVAVPGWQRAGRAQVGLVGEGAFAIPESIRPVQMGSKYFVGGWGDEDPAPVLRQTIGMNAFRQSIDAGAAKFKVSALIGAPTEEELRANLVVTFLDENQKVLGSQTLAGPAITEIRKDGPQLLPREMTGAVPAKTAMTVIQLKLSGPVNNWHGVYMDNVSLVLSK